MLSGRSAFATLLLLLISSTCVADDMKTWLKAPVDDNPEKNFYFMLLGFDAPDGVPLGRHGLEKYEKLSRNEPGAQRLPSLLLKGLASLSDDMRMLRQEQGFLSYPYDCLEPVSEEMALVSLLLEKYESLLPRYRELMTATHVISDPHELGVHYKTLLMLDLNFLSVMREIIGILEHDDQSRLVALARELTFWRRIYRDADETITRLSALLVYRQTVSLIHAAGLFHQTPGIDLPKKLGEEELSLLPLLQKEFRSFNSMLENPAEPFLTGNTDEHISHDLSLDVEITRQDAFQFFSCIHTLRKQPARDMLRAAGRRERQCKQEPGVLDTLESPAADQLLAIINDSILESLYKHVHLFNLYLTQLDASLTLRRDMLIDPARFAEIAFQHEEAHPGLVLVYDSDKELLGFAVQDDDSTTYKGLNAVRVCYREGNNKSR